MVGSIIPDPICGGQSNLSGWLAMFQKIIRVDTAIRHIKVVKVELEVVVH